MQLGASVRVTASVFSENDWFCCGTSGDGDGREVRVGGQVPGGI